MKRFEGGITFLVLTGTFLTGASRITKIINRKEISVQKTIFKMKFLYKKQFFTIYGCSPNIG